jgi:hypothetical protein
MRCNDKIPSYRITPSPFSLDPGLSMLPSSAPLPLCPRFRPVMPGRWKPWCARGVGSVLAPGFSEADSPNRDKKLFFLGFASSLRPTSSNPSSCVAPGFSSALWLPADFGKRAARESSEPRDGWLSGPRTGDLPDMSWNHQNDTLHCLLDVALTNDLRYDSKDSRDMVKASFSLMIFLWAEDWLEWGDLCQKLFFSGGEG